MSEENTTNNTAPQTSPEDAAELTINDLAAVKSIIDVASQRGAFKPNEMIAIGTVYNKIDKFLAAATKQGQPNA